MDIILKLNIGIVFVLIFIVPLAGAIDSETANVRVVYDFLGGGASFSNDYNVTFGVGQVAIGNESLTNTVQELGIYYLNSTTINDTTAPSISNVNATSITNSSAIIVWNTNENSNSSVSYGTNLSNLNLSAGQDDSVTSHSVSLAGLLNYTTYFYNVTSCDASGNCNTSEIYNFTTSQITISSSICLNFKINNLSSGNTVFSVDCDGDTIINSSATANSLITTPRSSPPYACTTTTRGAIYMDSDIWEHCVCRDDPPVWTQMDGGGVGGCS